MEENQNQQVPVNEQQAEEPTPTKKKPSLWVWITVGVFVLLIIVVGFFVFISQSSQDNDSISSINETITTEKTNKESVVSDFGFSFTVPAGWHIWEGASASSLLITNTNFLSDVKTGLTQEEEISYQEYMNDWNVKSSPHIVFTNAGLDYEDRSLTYAGRIASTIIDSTEMLDLGAIELSVSNQPFDLRKNTEDERVTVKNIKINGTDALLFRISTDDWKVVEWVWATLPLETERTIDGEKVQSLIFRKYVRKGDEESVNGFVDFISDLNITTIPK